MNASELISEITKRPVVQLDTAELLDNVPDFDSIAMVNLVVRLESLLGRQLSEGELGGLLTVGALETLLKG